MSGSSIKSAYGDRFFPSFVILATPATLIVADEAALALLNRQSTKVIRIWAANVSTSPASATSGSLMAFALRKFTETAALTGGVDQASAIQTMDSDDVLPSAIDVQTKPTKGAGWVDGPRLSRILLSEDEPDVSVLDADAFASQVFPRTPHYWWHWHFPLMKPITLRTDGVTFQGIYIQHITGVAGTDNLECALHFTVSDE